MDALIPIHNTWDTLIFSGYKLFEFRNQRPVKLLPNSKVYLYETAKDNGCQAVVGEIVVDKIITSISSKACLEFDKKADAVAPYICDYFNRLKGEPDIAKAFKKAKSISMDLGIPYHSVIRYALSPAMIEIIAKTGTIPDTITAAAEQTKSSNFFTYFSNIESITNEIENQIRLTAEKIEECHQWLVNTGFYYGNEEGSRYAIGIKYAYRYEEPILLSDFVLANGDKEISFAPQTLIYVKKKQV